MASMTMLQTMIPKNAPNLPPRVGASSNNTTKISFGGSGRVLWTGIQRNRNNRSSSIVVAAIGDVSSDGTAYLVAGAIAVALVGTAFPIFFSRKDT